jgi:putative peptide zinc metalloprotease protein
MQTSLPAFTQTLAPPDPAQVRLPAWREDLELQAAPRGLDGAPYWNLYDPARNRFFRIGWLEFMLLSHWRTGISTRQLCELVQQHSPLHPEIDDVLNLLQFLEHNELLRASSINQRNKLQQLAHSRQLSLWQWLLHHYLFVRIPLIQPERFLRATQGVWEWLCRPLLMALIAALGLLGMWRVINQWDAFAQTFLYFFSWQGALLYALALALTKLLHEFGHAYTARHYGLRVPTMGVAIMMLWPMLYTDTSEGWKLNSRRARLGIGAAGVVTELLLAGIAALAWSVLPEGPLKSAAYILAAVTWISTLAINLNPFMRFDGYYLMMDAIDMPNLHERSFAFARWHLRRHLLGWVYPFPESEHEARAGWLIAFAYATWLYRLVLFVGIAAAVYYFFFKLLGIILFAVEIGWFVVRPVVQESKIWFKNRDQWRGTGRAYRSLALLLAVLILVALPWHTSIQGDGYLQAAQHTRIFPPNPARIQKILVQEGQSVLAGQTLLQLESPEIEAQLRAIESRIAGHQAQLAGVIGAVNLIERTQVLQQELASAEASRNFLLEERARLRLSAPHDGVVRDLESGLYAGSWVAARQVVARVVKPQGSQAFIFVSESDVARLKTGASAKLVLSRADTRVLPAVVSNIDPTPTRILPQAMLASTHGGPIAVRPGPRGELNTTEAWYRVTLTPEASISNQQPNQQLSAIHAHIQGERQSLLWQFILQVSGIAIRESGL